VTIQPMTPSTSRENIRERLEARTAETLLVIEDDPQMRSLLAATLRKDGYLVKTLQNGDDALVWLGPGVLYGERSRRPSIIVSDIRLPFASGFEILESVGLATHRIPVILITGFGDDETRAHAMELGACCVLDKPFDMHTLRDAVRRVLAGELYGGQRNGRRIPG
jgi:DNA-binding NtrC family response regulator